MAKFHNTKPALFQIGGQNIVFLIDFYNLGNSQELDMKLQEIFTSKHLTIVGFAFQSDVEQFAKKFPKMSFYRYITNFVDAQNYFAKVHEAGPQTGLAKVSEKCFGKPICKKEQMSNWERRPLRLSQQHYAALDAYILVRLIHKLDEDGQLVGHPLSSNIVILDKRTYKAKNADDSGEDPEQVEEQKEDYMTQKIQTTGAITVGKKKNFGATEETKKDTKDFIPSEELTPEMKHRGFIVN